MALLQFVVNCIGADYGALIYWQEIIPSSNHGSVSLEW
jgi:hypothetical protein